MRPKNAAAHMARHLLHHDLKALVIGGTISLLALLAIRGLAKSAPAGPAIAVQSAKGPVALGACLLAAVVIWVKAHGHQAAALAPHHAARQKVITRTVIQHVASHAGLNWPEAAAVIVGLVLAFVLWLNHR